MKRYLILGLLLSGCSGAAIKKDAAADIANDLKQLVQQNADCPALCAALKAYIASKLP